MSTNGVIGKDNELPWRLPKDMKHFMSSTMGKPVIMGRKTFESMKSPLPGRTNIVLTRDQSWSRDGVLVAWDLSKAFELGRISASRIIQVNFLSLAVQAFTKRRCLMRLGSTLRKSKRWSREMFLFRISIGRAGLVFEMSVMNPMKITLTRSPSVSLSVKSELLALGFSKSLIYPILFFWMGS